jgi:hypothetical protein
MHLLYCQFPESVDPLQHFPILEECCSCAPISPRPPARLSSWVLTSITYWLYCSPPRYIILAVALPTVYTTILLVRSSQCHSVDLLHFLYPRAGMYRGLHQYTTLKDSVKFLQLFEGPYVLHPALFQPAWDTPTIRWWKIGQMSFDPMQLCCM